MSESSSSRGFNADEGAALAPYYLPKMDVVNFVLLRVIQRIAEYLEDQALRQ